MLMDHPLASTGNSESAQVIIPASEVNNSYKKKSVQPTRLGERMEGEGWRGLDWIGRSYLYA